MRHGFYVSGLLISEVCYHKGYGSYVTPVEIIILSGTAQEQPGIKGSDAEGSVVLAEEKRDQSGLKALHTSSDVFLLLQCWAEPFWLPFSITCSN